MVFLVAALMAGCASAAASPSLQVESPAGSPSSPESPRSTPSTAEPTAASSPLPATSPLASTSVIEVGGFAEVVVDALNIRSNPGVVSGGEVPQATSLLERGSRVFLAEGPVRASGYDWYFVSEDQPVFWIPMGCTPGAPCDFPGIGWVAIGPQDDPWLRPVDPCPTQPGDALALHAMGPLARLSCLGDKTTTIQARLSLGEESIGWQMPLFIAEPAWLGGEYSPVVLIESDEGGTAVLPVRFAPTLGDCSIGGQHDTCALRNLDGELVELDLVIDHPSAIECVSPDGASTPQVILRCRAQLVVIEVHD